MEGEREAEGGGEREKEREREMADSKRWPAEAEGIITSLANSTDFKFRFC